MNLNNLLLEVENKFLNNDFQLDDNEGIDQRKASKLNRFKFANFISLKDKKDYLDGFFLTLSLYNYYFFSDEKNDNRLEYINKVIKYKDKLIVPYAINWQEEKLNYYLYGANFADELNKDIIKIDKIEFTNLEELEITDLDSFDYLFLGKR